MSLLKSDALKIKKVLSRGKKFLVVSHMDPEGDAIGSTLAVYGYLRSLGKKAWAFNRDGVPMNLKFLKDSDKVRTSSEGFPAFDATFVLDCSEFERVDRGFPGDLKLGTVINIDQHLKSKGGGDISVIDPKASSASEILFDILRILKARINPAVAEALYTAIFTDTGSFRYSNSTANAFKAAAFLVEMGAKPWKVAMNIYEEVPSSKLKLISGVLSTLEVFEKEAFASVTLTDDMIKKTGALPEFSDGLVNYPRSISGIEVSMIFKEAGEGVFKVGMRSKGKVDVSKIASRFGGGGHKNAAGFTVRGDLKSVKDKVYEETRKATNQDIGIRPGS